MINNYPQQNMTTALTTASMTLATAIVCLALATNMLSCEAYAFMRPAVQQQRQQVAKKPVPLTPFMAGPTATSLFSSPEEGEEQQQQDQEVKAEGEQQEEEASEAEEAKQEEEQPPEDPEVVALKEAIADLERTLKEKQSTIQYLKEQAEQYSKSGYARKVAEMETMRRARSVSVASSSWWYLLLFGGLA